VEAAGIELALFLVKSSGCCGSMMAESCYSPSTMAMDLSSASRSSSKYSYQVVGEEMLQLAMDT